MENEELKCGKGILDEVKEQEPTSFNPGKYTIENIEEILRDFQKMHSQEMKRRNERINANLAHLKKRSKELGKDIPDILLAVVIVDQPMSSETFEKYEEWM